MATITAKPSRRTVRSLSVQEKVQAIDRVHDGESKASVARDLGVPESTLRGWCKGEEKLRGIVARSGGNASAHNTSQSSCDEEENKPIPDLLAIKPDLREYGTKININLQNNECIVNGSSNKREYPSQESIYHGGTNKKFHKVTKLDNKHEVPIVSDSKLSIRKVDSPVQNNKKTITPVSSAADSSSMKLETNTSTSYPHKDTTFSNSNSLQSLPALAAIASAMSNKNSLLYNSYTNRVMNDLVVKEEATTKPLDYSTKLPPSVPRPEMNDALMYWLQSQREHAALPMSPMEARTADSSSWFWKWYKNYGVLPQVPTSSNQKKVNGSSQNGASDDEDEPPATAADALIHGEKFLRWLECCSDPSVTALQILQFRYLLNNVKECAERRAQVRTKTKSRRK